MTCAAGPPVLCSCHQICSAIVRRLRTSPLATESTEAWQQLPFAPHQFAEGAPRRRRALVFISTDKRSQPIEAPWAPTPEMGPQHFDAADLVDRHFRRGDRPTSERFFIPSCGGAGSQRARASPASPAPNDEDSPFLVGGVGACQILGQTNQQRAHRRWPAARTSNRSTARSRDTPTTG